MLMCPECLAKQKELQAQSEAQAETRVLDYQKDVQQRLEQAKNIDNSIQTKSDIFNAQTVAIVELKKLIDEDLTIEDSQKNFRLASILTDRMNGLKKAIFDLNTEVIDKTNAQNAIQVYINNLSNKLRTDEREKIKLADINYQPNPIKVSKPRAPKVPKFDKVELNRWAQYVGVPASVIQMICVSKNITPEQAAHQLKPS